MTDVEQIVADYYERIWLKFVLWWKSEKTLGLHYALYEKGIHSFEKAELNMSDYVGRLLQLDSSKNDTILDAGCGVGGTSLYLAQKYPHHTFKGITITPGQYHLAKQFTQEKGIPNATFELCSYLNTPFQDESYTSIFALESTSYAKDKLAFVQEMNRILKPGGRIAVIDTFFVKKPHNKFMKHLHDLTCIGRGIPLDEDLLLSEFINHLNNNGFSGVEVVDLSKNVARSQLRSFLIGIPFFALSVLKYLCSFCRADLSKDPNYYLGTSVFCALYGLSKAGKYISIQATKT